MLLSQYFPSSRQHHRLLYLCREFEKRSESTVPPEDRLYPQSRGTKMTSECPSLIRSPIMNLPASLWLVNSSPQTKALINALLVTFTTTQCRKVQEYVSHYRIHNSVDETSFSPHSQLSLYYNTRTAIKFPLKNFGLFLSCFGQISTTIADTFLEHT